MLSPCRVAFLGGNGHCAARLEPARRSLPPEIALIDIPYPGFEGRPRAGGFEDFLDAAGMHLRQTAPDLVYGTGIGGLLALCLRARGELSEVPLLLQAPVLWGIERRWMPRVMRLGPAQRVLLRLFATAAFQRRFVRTYFTHPPPEQTVRAFFDGYARCAAAPDLFTWLTPALLRSLERDLATRPAALDQVRVWWGERDRVVSLQELEWTREALGIGDRWPVRAISEWGHYPMIDDPEGWSGELVHAMAAAGKV